MENQPKQKRNENQKKSVSELIEENIDWGKRHIDPAIMMRWRSATKVVPANSKAGDKVGTIYYPDGTRQMYTVGEYHIYPEE